MRGLEEDALQIKTFGVKKSLLEFEIRRETEWQEGEDPYSVSSIKGLLNIVNR